MNKKTFYLLIISLFFFLNACSDDEMMTGDDCPTPSATYDSGVFVINEGPFQNGTGTLSFFNPATSEVTNSIYQKANCDDIIGNIFQSVTHVDNRFYMVVNNADKLIVTDDTAMDKIIETDALDSPRYFLKIDNETAYVSQYTKNNSQGNIAVLDLNTLEITKTIPVGIGPENMIEYNGKIYVANAKGFDTGVGDSTVMIINPSTHKVEKTLLVGKNPNSFQIDKNGDLWVGCTGFRPSDAVFDDDPRIVNGAIARIAAEDVQEIINFDNLGAQKLAINPAKDRIYLIHGSTFSGSVFEFDITTKQLSTTPFIVVDDCYGLGINPENGHLFVSDANGFAATAEISEYNENGDFIQSFFTSIAPNGFIFK